MTLPKDLEAKRDELFFETTLLEEVSVNGRISKKLFEKVIPRALNQARTAGVTDTLESEQLKAVIEALEGMPPGHSYLCSITSGGLQRQCWGCDREDALTAWHEWCGDTQGRKG